MRPQTLVALLALTATLNLAAWTVTGDTPDNALLLAQGNVEANVASVKYAVGTEVTCQGSQTEVQGASAVLATDLPAGSTAKDKCTCYNPNVEGGRKPFGKRCTVTSAYTPGASGSEGQTISAVVAYQSLAANTGVQISCVGDTSVQAGTCATVVKGSNGQVIKSGNISGDVAAKIDEWPSGSGVQTVSDTRFNQAFASAQQSPIINGTPGTIQGQLGGVIPQQGSVNGVGGPSTVGGGTINGGTTGGSGSFGGISDIASQVPGGSTGQNPSGGKIARAVITNAVTTFVLPKNSPLYNYSGTPLSYQSATYGNTQSGLLVTNKNFDSVNSQNTFATPLSSPYQNIQVLVLNDSKFRATAQGLGNLPTGFTNTPTAQDLSQSQQQTLAPAAETHATFSESLKTALADFFKPVTDLFTGGSSGEVAQGDNVGITDLGVPAQTPGQQIALDNRPDELTLVEGNPTQVQAEIVEYTRPKPTDPFHQGVDVQTSLDDLANAGGGGGGGSGNFAPSAGSAGVQDTTEASASQEPAPPVNFGAPAPIAQTFSAMKFTVRAIGHAIAAVVSSAFSGLLSLFR